MRHATLNRLFLRYRDQHDGVALAAIFDATARELLSVAAHLVHDVAAAEDIAGSIDPALLDPAGEELS